MSPQLPAGNLQSDVAMLFSAITIAAPLCRINALDMELAPHAHSPFAPTASSSKRATSGCSQTYTSNNVSGAGEMYASHLLEELDLSDISLPTELWREIFCDYVALDDSPWRLTLVCKKWRSIAMNTKNLWTYIVVSDDTYKGSLTPWVMFGIRGYSNGRASVCRSVRQLSCALRRTGTLPLHISVISEMVRGRTYAYNLMDLLDGIFIPEISTRIVDLNIRISNACTTENLPFSPLSNLRCFTLARMPRQWRTPLLETICTSSSTSLRYIKLPQGDKPRRSEDRLDEDTMLDLITRVVDLETMDQCPHSWPNNETPPVEIPRLKSMVLACEWSYLARLDLPSLTSLTITDTGAFQDPFFDDSYHPNLPNLTFLCVTTKDMRWVEALVAPQLQNLSISELQYPFGRNPRVYLPAPNSFPTVNQLTLEPENFADGDNDEQDLLITSILKAMPNVESVRIATHSLRIHYPKLRMKLLERLGGVGEANVLCPKLRDLGLIARSPRNTGLLADEISLLERIADARREGGKELRRFLVEWRSWKLSCNILREF